MSNNPEAPHQTDSSKSSSAFVLSSEERKNCLYRISTHLLLSLAILSAVIAITIGVVVNVAGNGGSGPQGGGKPPQSERKANPGTGNAQESTQEVRNQKAGLTPVIVFFVGVLGGYVSLQRRLHTFSDFDLNMIAHSWSYTLLAPFVGGLLAVTLMYVFVGGLFTGPLFPDFKPGNLSGTTHAGEDGIISVLFVGASPASYGRLVFWSFVAGFSEKFVLNVIGQFEKKASEA